MKGNKEKTKFRATAIWKRWREHMKDEISGNIDYITHKKLYSGFNLHHLDPDHYDLLEESRFVCLNKQTHDAVEWLWKYYRTDPDVIKRLNEIMFRMKQYYEEGLVECSNERQELEDTEMAPS